MAIVTALTTFAYRLRTYHRGDRVTMRPIDAAVAARRRDVTLTVGATVTPEPVPEPPPTLDPPRRRRQYRRRDLVAEQ